MYILKRVVTANIRSAEYYKDVHCTIFFSKEP